MVAKKKDVPVKNMFKKGDIVILKSGGPPMTVDTVPSDLYFYKRPKGYYLTQWFKGASKESG